MYTYNNNKLLSFDFRIKLIRMKYFCLQCSRHKCILQRNNLTTTDGKINPSLAGQYLDKWVESTSDPAGFSEVMNLVKNRCLTDAPQPPNVPGACPHARFLMCSSSILFMVNMFF